MGDTIFDRMKALLKSEHYAVNDSWLENCIEFFLQQMGPDVPLEAFQFVKEQWQLSDLRLINNQYGSFPPNLSEEESIILPGNYMVQIDEMYDIASSKYLQITKLRDIIYKVQEPQTEYASKKRMIQLKLTDGIQELIAIEFSHMPQFDETLLPGYKALIVGPVRYRKGVLLLEKENFKGIGGEYDELLISHAKENVLARALGMRENPDPYNDRIEESISVPIMPSSEIVFEDGFNVDLSDISKLEEMYESMIQVNRDSRLNLKSET